MKINLGSGNTKKDGYTNLDIIAYPNVDIVCDVTKGIPLPDNSVEAVYAAHFVEHVSDVVALMEEIYRVSKPGAIVEIKCPYFKSTGAFKDPTHASFMTEKTFEYFDKEFVTKTKMLPDYRLKCDFKTESMAYIWSNKAIRFLPFKRSFFLKYFWNVARSIYFRLRVVK